MDLATFVIDSFTGRGIVSTVNDPSQLGRLAMIVGVRIGYSVTAESAAGLEVSTTRTHRPVHASPGPVSNAIRLVAEERAQGNRT